MNSFSKKCMLDSQYLNYLAVDIAERLKPSPSQGDIDKVEKNLKRCVQLIKG